MSIVKILSSKTHNPHYLNRYIKFIEYCSIDNQHIEKYEYYEEHHICPKAKDMFPEYKSFKKNPWNKINLTAHQHYIAHWLLWKTYSNSSQTYSFKNFCDGYTAPNQKRITRRISGVVYAKLKLENSIRMSELRKGKTQTHITCIEIESNSKVRIPIEEFREFKNIKYSAIGKGIPKSKEHREKIGAKQKGVSCPSRGRKGRTISEEQKLSISNRMKGNTFNKGIKRDPGIGSKISKTKSIIYLVLGPDGIEFETTIAELVTKTDLKGSTLQKYFRDMLPWGGYTPIKKVYSP